MKYLLSSFILLFFLNTTLAQEITETENEKKKYPYIFPIFGQQVQDMGIDFPYSAGVNVSYVYNEIYLGISEFGMGINGTDLSKYLNEKTLGFDKVKATSNSLNLRADLFALPFLNVYGMFSQVKGSTEVGLQPDFGDGKFPYFGSTVVFDAIAYGAGATFNYGYKDYFISIDGNYNATRTDLLKEDIGIYVTSFRFGKKFNLKKDRFVTFYAGIMGRNFTNHNGNAGSITINDALPGVDQQLKDWYDGLSSGQQLVVQGIAKVINDELGTEVGSGSVLNSTVDYHIKKDLLKKWTFQFGGQFQLNKRIWIRGEYGVSDYSKFLMTGVVYRFVV
ncbi:hypothetical protein [Flammeovirga agarivorans]|uniref:Outer membrane protein beta-barrel domain-containing protein n=1 Tax=Flammeovirga agarivorans TaxID=2726742 RepID=A0A7X8XW94_9BACT|nr:hypothetical protein [Flammeovirga agarivorans]NLR92102.1 hypothetical protein [Flammeovirga agarivorans]